MLAELVIKARKGVDNASQPLYLYTFKSEYFLAMRILKNSEDTEDVNNTSTSKINKKIFFKKMNLTHFCFICLNKRKQIYRYEGQKR
jgi:hypothetical protein